MSSKGILAKRSFPKPLLVVVSSTVEAVVKVVGIVVVDVVIVVEASWEVSCFTLGTKCDARPSKVSISKYYSPSLQISFQFHIEFKLLLTSTWYFSDSLKFDINKENY
jgi:hypothetical protein